MFKADLLQDGDKAKDTTFVMGEEVLSIQLGYLSAWKDGRLAVGGLLGESQRQ